MINQSTPKFRLRVVLGLIASAIFFAMFFMLQSTRLQAVMPIISPLVQEFENVVPVVSATETEFQTISGLLPSGSLSVQQPPASPEAVEDPVFMVAEVLPKFPGGQEAFQLFLKENLVYPKEAMLSNIQGTVFVSFVVERDGSLTNVTVL